MTGSTHLRLPRRGCPLNIADRALRRQPGSSSRWWWRYLVRSTISLTLHKHTHTIPHALLCFNGFIVTRSSLRRFQDKWKKKLHETHEKSALSPIRHHHLHHQKFFSLLAFSGTNSATNQALKARNTTRKNRRNREPWRQMPAWIL